jgi:hypothetical protein
LIANGEAHPAHVGVAGSSAQLPDIRPMVGEAVSFEPEGNLQDRPVNGSEAQESSLWLKASVAPVIVGRPTW